jgi:hypothetical protein
MIAHSSVKKGRTVDHQSNERPFEREKEEDGRSSIDERPIQGENQERWSL